MPTISKLQQRDLEALAQLHPDYDFEEAYLAHLQNLQHILVANFKDEDGLRHYFGYVCILWESQYTPFWRHNIPEIVNLYVGKSYRRQGIARELIMSIESACRKKGIAKVGVRLEKVGELAMVRGFYQALGYSEDGLGMKELCMVKNLL